MKNIKCLVIIFGSTINFLIENILSTEYCIYLSKSMIFALETKTFGRRIVRKGEKRRSKIVFQRVLASFNYRLNISKDVTTRDMIFAN